MNRQPDTNPAPVAFHESMITRVFPWIAFMAIGLVSFFIPVLQSNQIVKQVITIALTLCVIGVAKAVLIKRPVIILNVGGLMMRGLRPGIWKIFKLWRTEGIEDKNIVCIRAGYLRQKSIFGIPYPPGELSGAAVLQMFLWIEYCKNGRRKALYYPHLKNVAGFRELISCLEGRYGSKVEKFGI